MAKRTRYPSRTTARQTAKRAQRAASTASGGRVPRSGAGSRGRTACPSTFRTTRRSGPSTSGLTDAEVERAAQLEAEATAKEKAAIAESLRRRNRCQVDDHPVSGDINAPLSVRAAHEYAYVSRDVKRIAVTGGLMVAILAVLHILVNVLGVITL